MGSGKQLSEDLKIELVHVTWKKKNSAYMEKNTIPTVKHSGGSLMFLGVYVCIRHWSPAKSGRENECSPISTDFKAKPSTISQKAKNEEAVDPSTRQRSKTQSKSTQEWFKKNKVNVLPWPSQSPDLNIIENLCMTESQAIW
ncbi:hypothetical protein QTP70_030075 [Hemibagrus guttatus]|uniref:Tc1-like transposase DDE domain-containing protein n=1 Tax=Hemibagrus guttatus TaxID=175788 RepID=A0AAE0V600_9TELE|nr:hypothetical protein QTP70_030075 [Hemibagrus guttatus]KAK3569328.1 hypothetical protein QTP86_026818 [Hemibagrus guttatus]